MDTRKGACTSVAAADVKCTRGRHNPVTICSSCRTPGTQLFTITRSGRLLLKMAPALFSTLHPLLLSLELTSLELVFSYSSLLKFSLSSAFCTLHYYWNLLSWIFFNIFLTTLYVNLMIGIFFFFRIESQSFGQTIHNVGREVAALPRCAVNYKLWTVSKWPASLEMCGPPSRDRYTCFARPACGSCCCRMWSTCYPCSCPVRSLNWPLTPPFCHIVFAAGFHIWIFRSLPREGDKEGEDGAMCVYIT